MLNKRPLLFIFTLLTFVNIVCCSSTDEDPATPSLCSTSTATFTDANAIIESSCALPSCHASGTGNGPGPLLTYTQIFNARASIKSAVASGRMPRNGSLTTDQKNTIICWIENGALNN